MQNEWKNKKCLVIGLGISGRSAAGFLLSLGAGVSAIDKRDLSEDPEIRHLCAVGMKVYREGDPIECAFYLGVVSPGVSPNHPVYRELLNKNVEVIGEVELACRHLRGRMVGITGTNGKTTVTFMTAHILNAAGIPALALGNSGTPLTSILYGTEAPSSDTVIVAELSSYQLETMHSPVIDVGVILNITPDHLDRYPSMNAYSQAKLGLARLIKKKGLLYVEEECYSRYGHLLPAEATIKRYGYNDACNLSTDLENVYFQGVIEYILPSDLKGKKSHDLENLLAVYGACREFGVLPHQFLEAAATFNKPPHRIEAVRERLGVFYVNDSKGTNIDAVIRAVQSLPGPIILIAGGVDKGASYRAWIETFAGKVRFVCAIGEAAEKISREISSLLPVHRFTDLEQAVVYAADEAVPGDTVLLSPGCSSLDMFKDYAHRGNEFKRIVNSF